MLSFFQTIIEYIQIIWSFFLNMITGLVTAFGTLFGAVGTALTLSGYVPWFVSTSFIISIFIVIVNYLIGRDNQ